MSLAGKILLGILGLAVLAGVGLWLSIRHVASDITSHMITTVQFKGVHVGENRDAVRDRLGEPGGLQPQNKPKPPAGTTCDYYLQKHVSLEKKQTFQICYQDGKVTATQALPSAEDEAAQDNDKSSESTTP
ncbi:hypothetical protein BX281_10637 [Streptomyces sp. Ag82_O1-15]|uniref:hypothetical protein n=1 Tax=Streptomyces sp. Ag82_O1-15 TaxID=1938855 RepID=UPI000BB0D5A1|nr:hypothetical protein [Streptomyces sp. Ag82_O1-15]PBD02355.1 hypothetical protein BX281_10637 [Streptomyces sp. Ag82_O1-15]